ncbi:MAG: efflux RND transporter permease subunit [Spirochaetes bacterium]|nr:efflux RND transporter permease subunit [Spirochaetota bacterium]
MRVADFSIKHPAIVGILLSSLLVFALLSYASLNREMIPSVGLPAANIITAYPGASAREIERTVTWEIENQMSTLSGISSMESTSKDSYSIVSVDFRDGVDVYEKLPQIRELLNGILDRLPEGLRGAPEIIVSEASGILPIFSVRIDSEMDRVVLTKRIDEDLVPRLARVNGVSKVNIRGGAERRVRVELDLDRLEARGLSPLQVYEALRYANRNLPAGSADWQGNRLSLTTRGAFKSIEEASGVAVGQKDGTAIYLGDVATVSVELVPPEFRIRSAGRDVLVVDVLKRDDGNTIGIVKESKRELDAFSARLDGVATWKVLTDQAQTTQASLGVVVRSAFMGTLLAVLVILLFLHDWRATLIIGASIPFSILMAIVGMRLAGQTLNLLSLAGITVAIGMIVDASIVILENTWDWYLKTGDRKLAASRGADEVGGAVLASTITTVAVFVPLIFLTGIIGIVMKDLSQTIVYALSASVVVALAVVPFLVTKVLREGGPARKPAAIERFEEAIDRAYLAFENAYGRALRRALENKVYVLALAVAVFGASVLLLGLLPVSFIPPTDTGEFEIHVILPAGYSLDRSVAKMDEIERLVEGLVPEIDSSVYYAGASSSLAIAGSPDRGFARIRLVPTEARKRSVHELIPLVREAIARNVPDCDAAVLNGGFDSLVALATGGQGFRLAFHGTGVEEVAAAAEAARGLLEKDPDVVKAETSADLTRRQLFADLSQRAMATLGVTPYEAGTAARLIFTGLEAGEFNGPDGEMPIVVGSPLADRPVTSDVLDRISLVTRDGRTVRFAAFSELKSEAGVSTITKKNRAVTVELVGYLRGEDQGGVSKRMALALGTLDLPPGVSWETTGTSELIGDSLASLSLVLGIAIFLVYAVMVIQFERYVQPLIIMASVPFCLIGVVGGLLAFGSALSIIAMLGLITLGGTVVNNAIVMVDFTNLLRRRDCMILREAIVSGATSRLKPILMTTLTTIVGVIPMALTRGDGSEVYAPLGQAILGGLSTSTLITLFIIPVLYEATERRLESPRVAQRAEAGPETGVTE